MNSLNTSLKQQINNPNDSDKDDIKDNSNTDKIHNKKKIIIIFISIILVIAIISAILILHFKFRWFKKDEDIYTLPINIITEVNQVTYFTEKKIITSNILYSSGKNEELGQIINTEFMVALTESITDKEENTINYATLIILDSNGKIGENSTKLNSFNIFDELIVNQFELNPNGTQYPMGKFSFFKNGTISEIKLPNDMDKYNAQAIIELINNIIVKITRNKKEEEMEVKLTKINSNRSIISEIFSPKEYVDKYTNIKYEGSTFSKSIIRDIDNERIKNINTNTKLNLKTQKQENEVLDFGLDNYNLNIDSEISMSHYDVEQKELSQLIKKLSQKLVFIKSEDLIKSILAKEQEEIKNEQKNENLNESESEFEQEYFTYSNGLRKLLWAGSFSYRFDFIKTNILGQTIEVYYEIELSNEEIKNELCLDSSFITLKLGNSGVFSNKEQKKKELGKIPLFKIPFPGCPIPISINFEISGNIGFSVGYDEKTEEFSITLNGELSANAEVEAGIKYIFTISVGANGVLIGVSATSNITRDLALYIPKHSIKIYGGKITLYVQAKIFIWRLFYIGFEIFKGWSKTLY